MVDSTLGPDAIDERRDLGTDDEALYEFWAGEERIAAKEEHVWHRDATRIIKRYRDERPNTGARVHRMNILWSNVQTLGPALYARTPKPDVQRRWLDQDDTGRLASLLLERSIAYSLDNCGFDQVMEGIVQDRLLPGRGVPRVMYIPHYGDPIPAETPMESDKPEYPGHPDPGLNDEFEDAEAAPVDVDNPGDKKAEPVRAVVYEEVIAAYVYWRDYREGPARTWREVPWIRYRAYMDRAALIKRFGAIGKKVNLDLTPKGSEQQDQDKSSSPPDIFKKAIVHEIWDKTRKQVVWLAPGTPGLILDKVDDPLRLPDFYPSPDPLLATTTTDKRIPVPDYIEYKDQADELDTLTARIDTLTRALKVSGLYPASLKSSLQQLVDEGTENRLIPVEDWAMLADKGGLANAIHYFPVKQVADTLIQLYAARDKTKDLLYEITGIGDIMRGQTQPTETLGAQQLKANFSTRRIQPQQRAVARIARDTIRLMGAVIAEHFSPQTISMITGYPQLAPVPMVPPQPPQFLPAPPPIIPPQAALPAPPPQMAIAPPSPQLPPQAMQRLAEGRVTRFGNGQRWTLARGQPRRVA